MRRSRKIAETLVAGVLVAGLVGGCGGGEDGTETASVAQEQSTVGEVEGSASAPSIGGPLGGLAAKLEAAGYSVVDNEEPGDAQAALTATSPDGAELRIAYYSDPKQAEAVGREIEQIFAETPGRGLVAVQGHVMLNVAEERQLKASEKRALAEVARLAEEGE